MKRLMGRLAILAVALLCLGSAASAAERKTVTLADGTEMEFALAVPPDFQPDATYPALLVLPGGEQTIEGAIGQVERLWQTEAARRGYLVFGLAALWGGERPFHGQFADDTLIPQFLDQMRAQFQIENDKFHLAGFSAGAQSAIRIAALRPELFRSLTVMSGYEDDPAVIARLPLLKELPIAMFAGQNDQYVAAEMVKNGHALEAAGIKVSFDVIPGAGHSLTELRTPQGQAYLFDRFDRPERRTVTLADGAKMEFALALPANYKPDATYPALLVLPGGEQTIDGAISQVQRFWKTEAAKRGYLVFGASAPVNRPFFGALDDVVLSQFMDQMRAQFHIEGGTFHLAGFSAGAQSVLELAARRPELARSLTIMAGYTDNPADVARLSNLKDLPIAMFVGQNDEYVAIEMAKNRDALEAAGIKVLFEVVPGSGHSVEGLRTPEGQAHLFDQVSGLPGD